MQTPPLRHKGEHSGTLHGAERLELVRANAGSHVQTFGAEQYPLPQPLGHKTKSDERMYDNNGAEQTLVAVHAGVSRHAGGARGSGEAREALAHSWGDALTTTTAR